MPWPFLIALAGIAWLAYSTYLDHQRKLAKTGAAPDALRDVTARLDAAEADRERLRARVEALEAIVTDDGFDLARDARRAGLPAMAAPDGRLDAGVVGASLADPPHPTATESADVARRARA